MLTVKEMSETNFDLMQLHQWVSAQDNKLLKMTLMTMFYAAKAKKNITWPYLVTAGDIIADSGFTGDEATFLRKAAGVIDREIN